MGKSIIINGADFSENAIPIAKTVDGTSSPQYVYVANVEQPNSSFDWDSHKVEIHINSDGTIGSFNLPDDTTYIPNFTRGSSQNNNWLKEIDVRYLSSFPLKTFHSMLENNIALTKVIIGGKFPYLTGNETLREMLYGCTSLEEVIIDDSFDAPLLDKAGYLFYTAGVRKVSGLRNLIKSSVVSIEYLFCNANNIKSVDLTNCNTSNVRSFKYLFSGCTSLEKVIGLNELDTTNVTEFSYSFFNCGRSALPLNVDISNWHITSNAGTTKMFQTAYIKNLNANCFTKLRGDVSGMFYMNNWNTINLDNLNDISEITLSDSFISKYVSGIPKITIANVTNEAVKTFLKSKLNAVSAGGSSDWQEATVDGVLCLVPNV